MSKAITISFTKTSTIALLKMVPALRVSAASSMRIGRKAGVGTNKTDTSA